MFFFMVLEEIMHSLFPKEIQFLVVTVCQLLLLYVLLHGSCSCKNLYFKHNRYVFHDDHVCISLICVLLIYIRLL